VVTDNGEQPREPAGTSTQATPGCPPRHCASSPRRPASLGGWQSARPASSASRSTSTSTTSPPIPPRARPRTGMPTSASPSG